MILPRIHRINLLVWFTLVVLLVSCKRRTPNDLYVVAALKVSMENLTKQLEKENEITLTSFQMKTEFPETKHKAELLLPLMLQVKNVTSSLLNDINNAQLDLRIDATSKDVTKPIYYADNLDAVKRVFIKGGRASILYKRLKLYETQLKAIAKRNKDYRSQIFIDIPENETHLKGLDNFLEFFKYQPAISVDAFLESLKVNVRLNEKRMLSLISNSITNHLNHYSTEVLMETNMRHFKSGDQLQVTAGIAAFKYYPESYMLIYGKKILPDERGRFVYDTIINKAPGNYQIPIVIGYVEADGNPQSIIKKIDYSVIK